MIVNSNYKAAIRKKLKAAYGAKRTYTSEQMFKVIYDDAIGKLRDMAGPKRFKKEQGEIEFRAKGLANSIIMDWDKDRE